MAEPSKKLHGQRKKVKKKTKKQQPDAEQAHGCSTENRESNDMRRRAAITATKITKQKH